jgi:leucyl aminopeptidase
MTQCRWLGITAEATRVWVVTDLSVRSAKPTTVRTDAVVIGVVSAPPTGRSKGGGKAMAPAGPAAAVAKAFGRGFIPMLASLGFEGKAGQTATLPSGHVLRSPVVVVVGLGEEGAVDDEALRRAAAAGMKAISNAVSVAIALPAADAAGVRAVGEGVLLGLYTFDRYRSEQRTDPPGEVVVLTENARHRDVKQAVSDAAVVSRAVNLARDWVNTPPRDLTPELFAQAVSEHRTKAGGAAGKVKVTVLDEAALAKQGCGGILGVGQGSDNPPRLVRLEYSPRKPAAHLALVGKGITFDSGGLSLKTGTGMMTMKCDMGGAAAVLAATYAIAELGVPVKVTTFASMAENMPGGGATRPGDVLTMRSGATVEVLNTDAEGRLVLADALDMATEAEPDLIVDVATLTGACVVALGTRVSGVLSNDEGLLERVPAIADRAGEAMWALPIPDEMKGKVTSSSIADLRQHNPEPYGGTLYAAAFLREFVKEQRWVHLDIAGPAFNDKDAYGYTPKGGTGAAVRTLVRLAQEAADGALAR